MQSEGSGIHILGYTDALVEFEAFVDYIEIHQSIRQCIAVNKRRYRAGKASFKVIAESALEESIYHKT
jgi:hypothetical protein